MAHEIGDQSQWVSHVLRQRFVAYMCDDVTHLHGQGLGVLGDHLKHVALEKDNGRDNEIGE